MVDEYLPFYCNICGKEFANPSEVGRHKGEKHE